MSEGESPRDLSGLVVARVGRLTATGHTSEPYILQGSDDERVGVRRGVLPGADRFREVGGDGAFIRYGSAEVVAVPSRCGCGVGSCLSGRCARFQLLDPVDGEGTTRISGAGQRRVGCYCCGGSESCHRQTGSGDRVLAGDSGAQ